MADPFAEAIPNALKFHAMGWGIVPAWSPRLDKPKREDGLHPCSCPKGRACKSPGKHPAIPKDPSNKLGYLPYFLKDDEAIRTALSNPGTRNYLLVPPPPIALLDLDGEGLKRWSDLREKIGPPGATLMFKTPHGFHVAYPIEDDPGGNLLGIVTRRHPGGGVIGPGSVHPSGAPYLNGGPMALNPMNPPWREAIHGPGAKKPHSAIPVGEVGVGERHDWLRDEAISFVGRERIPKTDEGLEKVWAHMKAYNAALAEPKTDDDLLRAIGDPWAALQPNTTLLLRRKDEPGALAPNLPSEFWATRPVLAKIRDAAWSRQRSPDAVFLGVLTRVTAALPHTIALPPIVGGPAGTAILATVVSQSGVGKSTSASIAEELVVGKIEVRAIPGGTGEGMTEAYFDMVEVTNDKGKTTKVKRQVWHNLHVYVDEISKTLAVGKREGATVYEMLRQAFSGQALGEHNASAERRRVIVKGNYSLGVLLAAQPHVLGPLFDDVDAGTPSRFLYLAGTDPGVPDTLPPWPGSIDIDLPQAWNMTLLADGVRIGPWPHHVIVDDDIANEIRARDRVKVRGVWGEDAWAGHRDLIRLKVAFVLAVLDKRVKVRPDDWELACTVVDVSDAVRAYAQSVVAAVDARRETAYAKRAASREVVKVRTVTAEAIRDTAVRIFTVVKADPGGLTPGTARAEAGPSHRGRFKEAFDHAISAGWIVEKVEAGQGDDKRRLWPGRKSPDV